MGHATLRLTIAKDGLSVPLESDLPHVRLIIVAVNSLYHYQVEAV